MADGYHAGRRSAGAIPWLAGGALVIVVVFGIAFAVLLTGNTSPTGPSPSHKPQALAASSPPATTAPAQSASPSPSAHKPAPKSSHPASSPAPSVTSQAPSPTPKPTHKPPKPPPPPTVQLTATVNVWGQNSGSSGTVLFQVNDTGSAASGQVTVTITLPAGASMTSGGGGGGESRTGLISADWNSWSCQATSTGATCTNAGISAGNQASGAIDFLVSGSSVCGQPVDLTAASGSASANAQATVGC